MSMTRVRFRRSHLFAVRWVAVAIVAGVLVSCRDVPGSRATRDQPSTAGRSPATAAGPAPAAQSSLTENCTPCTFEIGQGLPRYAVRLSIRDLPDEQRVVDALQVSKADGSSWTQSLAVHGMMPIMKTEDFFIAAEDINFDGYNDLSFATSRGVANTYADYWLFDPPQAAFRYLGNYPLFKVDLQRRELTTYERGGDGGMVYKSKRYAIVNGAPIVVASEEQEATDVNSVYRRTVSELRDGRLTVVKRESVRVPKQE